MPEPKVLKTFKVTGIEESTRFRVVRNSLVFPVLEKFTGCNAMRQENWESVCNGDMDDAVIGLLKAVSEDAERIEHYAEQLEMVAEREKQNFHYKKVVEDLITDILDIQKDFRCELKSKGLEPLYKANLEGKKGMADLVINFLKERAEGAFLRIQEELDKQGGRTHESESN